MVATSTESKDSLVVFRTSQGMEVRALLLRLTRYLAVFEVCNPNEVFQTSEVLQDFRIILFDRTVYAGRAVVNNLVNTGLVTVCEAALGDSWADIDFTGSGAAAELGPQFEEFLARWQKLYRVHPDYKIVIADLQTFLVEVR